ncbi:hypothetical protein LEP1GSC081_0846 [Leptospira kirschneri str. H1]|uniref:Uncharacterized protein n=1 Tax=Leptospira kirschneri str. H1 TaxID=1049966 RepID=A0A0E2AZD1_9LEPT|nr:hypothetical protein LEP1GSC081_0846 [Leptospira kirschneri str. H1]
MNFLFVSYYLTFLSKSCRKFLNPSIKIKFVSNFTERFAELEKQALQFPKNVGTHTLLDTIYISTRVH